MSWKVIILSGNPVRQSPPFISSEKNELVPMDKIPLEMSSDDMVIRYRDCFSVRYIQSAALLSRLGFAIEQEYRDSGTVSEEIRLRHEAFILNSILSSVAFLESTINEFYADAADGVVPPGSETQEALLSDIAKRWNNEKNFDRAPLITKYQKILSLTDRSPFEDGDRAYDNIRGLIGIRNHLMHYRREWVEVGGTGSQRGDESTAEKFAKVLKRKFAPNPFAQKNLPFFPDQCLGHGCAEWAVVNSIIFTDAFFRKLDLPVPYEGVRNELLTR